jgi:hypothetical protein
MLDHDIQNTIENIAQKIEDAINHPLHYTFGKYEVIDVLEDWFPTDPLLWQVGKYIARAGHKGNLVEDLKKARWYLDRRIAKANGGQNA